MFSERFAAAHRSISRTLISCAALGIVMWTQPSGASPPSGREQPHPAASPPALHEDLALGTASLARPGPTLDAGLAAVYARVPLSFEANHGQAEPKVKFLARGRGYTLLLTPTEAVLSLRDPGVRERKSRNPERAATHDAGQSVDGLALVHMKLAGGNPTPEVLAQDRQPGIANYFIGNDPTRWHTKIPTYAKVWYRNVYPGVDLVYYGKQGELEYDFVVQPGANPKAIALEIETGNSKFETRQPRIKNLKSKIDANGNLVIQTDAGEVRFNKPTVYQPTERSQSSVVSSQLKSATDNPRTTGPANSLFTIHNSQLLAGRYVLTADNRIHFEIPSYDKTEPLIIDPALSYSTYLGGPNLDQANAIAVDGAGDAYVAGFASSSFPTTLGPAYGGGFDAFVTKLNASGSVVYATYLGGESTDHVLGIAVDAAGSAYVTGQTYSSAFPTTAGAYQPVYHGFSDAFVTKLSPDGSSLAYSTYIGGSGIDEGRAIAVDPLGNAYIAGKTYSTDFPAFPFLTPLQGANKGNGDAFVAELNASGSSLVYSTYLGGSDADQANGIAVDALGNASVTGSTSSSDFPVLNAPLGVCGSCASKINDAFVTEIGVNGSTLVYSTFLGGSDDDQGTAIALDTTGNAYVTGSTFSSGPTNTCPTCTPFPTTPGAFQTSLVGGGSAFVAKISAGGGGLSLLYSTYLGADNYTYGQGIAVLLGNAYVTGVTGANTFPAASPIQATKAGFPDAFLTQLDPTGTSLSFSTYLGGSSLDEANGIALDPLANAYVTGDTNSTNFPAMNASQGTYGGGDADAFVAKVLFPATVTLSGPLNFNNQPVGVPSSAQAVTVTNTGTAPLSISNITISGSSSSSFSQLNDCGSGVPVGLSCMISVTYTPTAAGEQSATLQISGNGTDSPENVSLSGTGIQSGTLEVSLSPPAIFFADQQVSTASAAQSITVSNVGTGSVTISSIGVTGANAGDFGSTHNCPLSPLTLAPQGTCTISVAFYPTAAFVRNATVRVIDNAIGSPHTVILTGTGKGPVVSLSPGAVNFKDQIVGTTSGAETVRMANHGNATLIITSIAVTGTNSASFAQSNNCGNALPPGARCTINVTFAPIALGDLAAQVTTTHNATGGYRTVKLDGTGVQPVASLSPVSLSFLAQPVNTTSAPQTVTLSNTGTGTLTLSGITLGGGFAQTNNCGGSVAPKKRCTISVTFTPTAVGPSVSTLVVTDNSVSGSTQTVSLTATGL